jgi:hypothetical protein
MRRATRKANVRLRAKKTATPTSATEAGKPRTRESFHAAQEAIPTTRDSQYHFRDRFFVSSLMLLMAHSRFHDLIQRPHYPKQRLKWRTKNGGFEPVISGSVLI